MYLFAWITNQKSASFSFVSFCCELFFPSFLFPLPVFSCRVQKGTLQSTLNDNTYTKEHTYKGIFIKKNKRQKKTEERKKKTEKRHDTQPNKIYWTFAIFFRNFSFISVAVVVVFLFKTKPKPKASHLIGNDRVTA